MNSTTCQTPSVWPSAPTGVAERCSKRGALPTASAGRHAGAGNVSGNEPKNAGGEPGSRAKPHLRPVSERQSLGPRSWHLELPQFVALKLAPTMHPLPFQPLGSAPGEQTTQTAAAPGTTFGQGTQRSTRTDRSGRLRARQRQLSQFRCFPPRNSGIGFENRQARWHRRLGLGPQKRQPPIQDRHLRPNPPHRRPSWPPEPIHATPHPYDAPMHHLPPQRIRHDLGTTTPREHHTPSRAPLDQLCNRHVCTSVSQQRSEQIPQRATPHITTGFLFPSHEPQHATSMAMAYDMAL